MKPRQTIAALLLITASLATGAAPPKAELHGLSAVTPAATKPVPAGFTVSVGPVTLPKAADRPEIVLTVAPGKVEVQNLHRWANPLGSEIARVVAENLAQIFGRDRVWTSQSVSREADYRVELDVQRFESGPGPMVALDVRWVVGRGAEGKKEASRSIVRKGARDREIGSIVTAYSNALDVLSRDVAEILMTVNREQQ